MAVACGCDFTAVVTINRDVLAWGRGENAQLGSAQREHRLLPTRIEGLGDTRIVFISLGEAHAAAVAEDGALWTWGKDTDGRCGQGGAEPCLKRLGVEVFGSSPVVTVACGDYHTVAVTVDGHVWTCGWNGSGQLGLGDKTTRLAFTKVGTGREQPFGSKIVLVAAGENHSVAVSETGSVWTWGFGGYGCLGHNDERDRHVPVLLGQEQFGGADTVLVAAGFAHTLAVTSDGALWVWGSGFRYQLGLGCTSNRMSPTRISQEAFGFTRVRMAAAGLYHSLAVTDDGGLWTWGDGRDGRLGHNDAEARHVPTRVNSRWFGCSRVVSAAAGHRHSAALSEEGAIYTWGNDDEDEPGGLGHAIRRDRLVPTRIAQHLLGARVGYCHHLPPLHALAFAMGTHGRLGCGGSKGCVFAAMPSELVKRVVEACVWWPEGGATQLRGVYERWGL